MAYALIGLASLIHYFIFVMEALLWGTPKVNKIFGVDEAAASSNRVFAFNQGFYNLFLAVGSTAGVVISITGGDPVVGKTLIAFSATSMVGASIVLFFSKPGLLRGTLFQGAAPLLGLVFLFLK